MPIAAKKIIAEDVAKIILLALNIAALIFLIWVCLAIVGLSWEFGKWVFGVNR